MTTFNEETPTVVQTTDVRSSGPPLAPKRRKRFSSHSTRAITALALASLVGGGIDTALWPLRVLENGLIPFREGFRLWSPSFPLEIRVQGEMAQYYLIFTGLWILFYRKVPDPMQFF